MMDSQASSRTLGSSPLQVAKVPGELDLSVVPPIYVSLTHLSGEEAAHLEESLTARRASVTYDITEAKIVLSKVERKRRAQFDLRGLGLWTEEIESTPVELSGVQSIGSTKRRKFGQDLPQKDTEESTTEGESSSETDGADEELPSQDNDVEEAATRQQAILDRLTTPSVKVIRIAWMLECLAANRLIPVDEYLTFEGRVITPQTPSPEVKPSTPPKRKFDDISQAQSASPENILARARADAQETSPRRTRDFGIRRFGDKNRSNFTAPYAAGASSKKPLRLLLETTSEHEGDEPDTDIPPPPDWVTQHISYACQRRTPAHGPNEPFLHILKEIRTARLLTGDEIGVRAYSSSIASIAAYPYPLRTPREVLRLPGCDVKIANLFVEFANTGRVAAADAAKDDADLAILRLFYDIWGVGATTAREFYFGRGWKDLDDVVEFGWSGLSRVQQIGVKYYDELKLEIPREEVELIARVVHAHAVKVRDARVQSLLVGGYRRGKEKSGDVDLLVSHPDEDATKGLVTDIVASLEEEGCITHTLLLALTSTHRNQQTLPFRASTEQRGAGFDTLDKALVVWQDPAWPGQAAEVARDPKAKNPAPHRRVDIIVSPWRTVGCAVAGWSGGTTFQRDLRRYAKYAKGWKFDSSGIRERGTGQVVDVEGYFAAGGGNVADDGRGVISVNKWKRRAETMQEAEQRVFAGMGLDFIEPVDRCTG